MVVELREPALVQQITQLARTQEREPEDVVETAVRSYLEALEEQIIHRETEAFWKQHDELLALYPNQYVALRNGVVVDHDSDVSWLERRMRDRYGLAPVLIAPVIPGGQRDLQWRGGRIDRTGEHD